MLLINRTGRQGSVIVFLLMGLIAVLALGVVFLSRAGRDNPAATAHAGQATGLPAAETALTDEATTPGDATTTAAAPAQIVPPPPPTPIPEQDSKNLPPEG